MDRNEGSGADRPAQRRIGSRAPEPSRARLRLSTVAIAVGAVVLLLVAVSADRGAPKADERVVLFPTAAHLSGDGTTWEVPVHGWVYEPERDDVLRQAALDALPETLGLSLQAADRPLAERRLRPFLVDNQRGKVVTVEVAGIRGRIGPSDEHGHLTGTVAVPVRTARSAAQDGDLIVEARTAGGSPHTVRSAARLVGPVGISVISDIDDTIKISQVVDREALLRNTFAEPFRPVPGMAELYRRWAERGVTFHYVSGSPWQLYEALSSFIADQGLPVASLSLKRFRLTDSSLLRLFADPIRTKPPAIEGIFERFPRRRFCLVGDSGERDPEVYGLVARHHPEQVACVYIRNVTDEDPDGPRFREALATLERSRWQVFTDPSTLPFPDS